jgi:hypothetical protein
MRVAREQQTCRLHSCDMAYASALGGGGRCSGRDRAEQVGMYADPRQTDPRRVQAGAPLSAA